MRPAGKAQKTLPTGGEWKLGLLQGLFHRVAIQRFML